MNREVYDTLEKHLCSILSDYARNGIASANDVATVKNALSAINKIKNRESMECIGKVNSGYTCEEETHEETMTKEEAMAHVENMFRDALKEVLTKM